MLGSAADVGGQELGGDAGVFRFAFRQVDLFGADVDAGDVSAGVGPGERLLAAAALEVAEAQAPDVARNLEFMLAQQRSTLREELGGRPDVLPQIGDGVPGVAVGGGVVVHWSSRVSADGRRPSIVTVCAPWLDGSTPGIQARERRRAGNPR